MKCGVYLWYIKGCFIVYMYIMRAKTIFLGKGPQCFFWGKVERFLIIWENGPHFKKHKSIKLWVSSYSIMKFSKLLGSRINEKINIWNKIIYYSIFFILNNLKSINIMGIFYWNGEFKDYTGEKKKAILLVEAIFIRPLQRRVFWLWLWLCICRLNLEKNRIMFISFYCNV